MMTTRDIPAPTRSVRCTLAAATVALSGLISLSTRAPAAAAAPILRRHEARAHWSIPHSGRTFYLSPTGVDSTAPGTGTLKNPWKTLNFADTQVRPGDMVVLRGGTYECHPKDPNSRCDNANRDTELHSSGSMTAPITWTAFQPSPGAYEAPVLTISLPPQDLSEIDTLRLYGSNLVVDHISVTSEHWVGQGIWFAYWTDSHGTHRAEHDVVQNCTVYNIFGDGVLISGDHDRLTGCDIFHNGRVRPHETAYPFNPNTGLYTGGPYKRAQDIGLRQGVYIEGAHDVVARNRVHENSAFGIQLNNSNRGQLAHDDTISGNYVYGNGFGSRSQNTLLPLAGIVIANGQTRASSNHVISKNVVCGNAMYGFVQFDGQKGNQITKNVFCFNAWGAVDFEVPGTDTVRNDISYYDGDGNGDPQDSGGRQTALSSGAGVISDYNWYYNSPALVGFQWNGGIWTDLAGFRSQSGQDAHSSVTTNPSFTNPPVGRFDPKKAGTYKFCTPLIPDLPC
jgi:hypothetical protein